MKDKRKAGRALPQADETLEQRVRERTRELLEANERLSKELSELKDLMEQRQRLFAAIEQSEETVLITDTKGTILYVNPAFQKITGYTPAEALGGNPRVLKSGMQDEAFYRGMWDTLINGEVWKGHFINRRRDGTLFHEEATITPVRNEAGEIVNFVAVKRDVTREVARETQLRQSEKMQALGTLAGGIAHDFNNILFAISGFTELAMDDLAEGSVPHTNLCSVLQAADRAKDLVQQVLTFCKRNGQERVPIDIASMAEETLAALRASVPENLEILEDISRDAGKILADPAEIRRLLINLCSNAAHAMQDKGGVLGVKVEKAFFDGHPVELANRLLPGLHLRIAVSDTGHGMTPEIVERIFDPYFTTKEPGQGTGLGMSVVLGIVESNSGAVTVSSEPGNGSTFTVYFPVVAAAECGDGTERDATRPCDAQGLVMLVDDEPSILQMSRLMLEKLGYDVVPVADGLYALELFRERPNDFSLVIADMNMPKMTGSQLAKAVATIRPDMPIILCIGRNEDLREQIPSGTGATQIMMKPYMRHDIAQAIRSVFAAVGAHGGA